MERVGRAKNQIQIVKYGATIEMVDLFADMLNAENYIGWVKQKRSSPIRSTYYSNYFNIVPTRVNKQKSFSKKLYISILPGCSIKMNGLTLFFKRWFSL